MNNQITMIDNDSAKISVESIKSFWDEIEKDKNHMFYNDMLKIETKMTDGNRSSAWLTGSPYRVLFGYLNMALFNECPVASSGGSFGSFKDWLDDEDREVVKQIATYVYKKYEAI
jgi:hypothetical protein